MSSNYYVYILTNWNSRVLYVGVTNDLRRRLSEHGQGLIEGFTKQYHVHKLVYFEHYGDVQDAIHRRNQGLDKGKEERIDYRSQSILEGIAERG